LSKRKQETTPQDAEEEDEENCLFGASADPPTAGHQAILSWLSELLRDWVAVWAADNPLSLTRHRCHIGARCCDY